MVLKRNIICSGIEFFFIALSQFLILRIVSVNLGVAELGVWSVLISSIQMSKLLDPGAVSGSLKYIALSARVDDRRAIEKYVAASIFMVLIVYAPALILMSTVLDDVIVNVLDDPRLIDSLYLIPYICFSFLMQNISLCFIACINNMGFGFFKSIVNVLGMLLQLTLSFIFVNEHGLLGLTISQLANYIFSILVSLIILAFFLKLNIFRFFIFKISIAKKILKVGLFVQGTSIGWTLFELSIRLIMARIGGLDMSGYYEVAYRFAAQIRILSAYIIAPITPTFVQKYENSHSEFNKYYNKVYRNIASFGISSLVGLIAISPILSVFMFEKILPTFMLFIITCGFGALFHVLAMVSEQSAVSIGQPKFNLVGMLVILTSSFIFSYFFGSYFGASGVAFGVLTAIILGVVTTVRLNSKKILNVDCLPRVDQSILEINYKLKGGS